MRETLNESKPFLNVMLSVKRNRKIIKSCFRVINQTHRGSEAFYSSTRVNQWKAFSVVRCLQSVKILTGARKQLQESL